MIHVQVKTIYGSWETKGIYFPLNPYWVFRKLHLEVLGYTTRITL